MTNENNTLKEADITEMFKDYVQLDPADAVYTNRDLNLEDIKMVGFDMDYTLAVYHKETMEDLQFRLTIDSLIKNHNYPPEIHAIKYQPNITIRGLVVDKQRGDLLKTDVHGRVWRVMHGHRQLHEKEITNTYAGTKIQVGESRFNSLDSLFSIPETTLYINLLDFFDGRAARSESVCPLEKFDKDNTEAHIDHWKLFDDIRQCMDLIHFDGSLKSILTRDLAKYINSDPDIALTLHKLRSSGKRIFLLTNSEWSYTNAVMNYLLGNQLPEYSSWRAFFDVVITEAKKPAFFTPLNPFLVQNTKSGEKEPLTDTQNEHGFERTQVYSGGNMRDFEKLALVKGEEILYVGDHIYGDIVRTKKESLWRTCLVIDELSEEIRQTIAWARDIDEISQMNAQRLALDGLIGNQRALLVHIEAAIADTSKNKNPNMSAEQLINAHKILRRSIDSKKKELRKMDEAYLRFHDELERRFHPCWGKLFGEHGDLSRFGSQVRSYACIYTAKLTNLLRYSPSHLFRATGQMMSHERTLLDTLPVRKARLKGR